MYTGKPLPPLPAALKEREWVDGAIRLGQQDRMQFGADRREPVDARPVVTVRHYGGRVVVLPCTSKDRAGNPEFFMLDDQRVWWTRKPDHDRSYAFWRYEILDEDAMYPQKIGVLHHPARLALMCWLKERY